MHENKSTSGIMRNLNKNLDLNGFDKFRRLPNGDGSKPYPPGEHQNSW